MAHLGSIRCSFYYISIEGLVATWVVTTVIESSRYWQCPILTQLRSYRFLLWLLFNSDRSGTSFNPHVRTNLPPSSPSLSIFSFRYSKCNNKEPFFSSLCHTTHWLLLSKQASFHGEKESHLHKTTCVYSLFLSLQSIAVLIYLFNSVLICLLNSVSINQSLSLYLYI